MKVSNRSISLTAGACVLFAAGIFTASLSPRVMEFRIEKSLVSQSDPTQDVRAQFSARLDRRDGVILRKDLVVEKFGRRFRASVAWRSSDY